MDAKGQNVPEVISVIEEVPTQVTSASELAFIQDTGSKGVGATSAILFFNYVLCASLSLLWGMINASQITVKTPLFEEIKFPQNVIEVNKFLIKIATFDLIPT